MDKDFLQRDTACKGIFTHSLDFQELVIHVKLSDFLVVLEYAVSYSRDIIPFFSCTIVGNRGERNFARIGFTLFSIKSYLTRLGVGSLFGDSKTISAIIEGMGKYCCHQEDNQHRTARKR